MRAVVQRVRQAAVEVDGVVVSRIEKGLVVLVGVAQEDAAADARYIATKVRQLRVFDDDHGKMNLAVGDVDGAILLVSQFTLCGDARKGRRPSYDAAAAPALALPLFDEVGAVLREAGEQVLTGVFGANMQLHLVNDGPVTLLLDSRRVF